MSSHFPHKCPACKSAAYVGAAPVDVDCSNYGCKFSKRSTPGDVDARWGITWEPGVGLVIRPVP